MSRENVIHAENISNSSIQQGNDWTHAGGGQEVPPVPVLPPPIGSIVHYTSLGSADNKYPPQVIAAMVTRHNNDGTVSLKCFYPTGIFDIDAVGSNSARPGTVDARGKWYQSPDLAP